MIDDARPESVRGVDMMDSRFIKGRLVNYFYSRGMFAVTECYSGFGGIADILAYEMKRKKLYEVEIKVSLSDLRADKKKDKYILYQHLNAGYPSGADRFYFAVPKIIVKESLKYIEANYPQAGLIVIQNKGNVFVAKGTAQNPSPSMPSTLLNQMMYRATAELAKFYKRTET